VPVVDTLVAQAQQVVLSALSGGTAAPRPVRRRRAPKPAAPEAAGGLARTTAP
jgi:hypothetical protein